MFLSRFLGKKIPKSTQGVSAIAQTLIETDRPESRTVVCVPIRPAMVPIRPVTVQIRSVTVPIRSVTVHLARRSFQDCVVFCLLPLTLVYFAMLKPGLFSVYILIYCTTTKTRFSELPQALCCSTIVFSVTRAVIKLLPNILWCHLLLALDILFPEAIITTKLALLNAAIGELLTTAPAHVDKHI